MDSIESLKRRINSIPSQSLPQTRVLPDSCDRYHPRTQAHKEATKKDAPPSCSRPPVPGDSSVPSGVFAASDSRVCLSPHSAGLHRNGIAFFYRRLFLPPPAANELGQHAVRGSLTPVGAAGCPRGPRAAPAPLSHLSPRGRMFGPSLAIPSVYVTRPWTPGSSSVRSRRRDSCGVWLPTGR